MKYDRFKTPSLKPSEISHYGILASDFQNINYVEKRPLKMTGLCSGALQHWVVPFLDSSKMKRLPKGECHCLVCLFPCFTYISAAIVLLLQLSGFERIAEGPILALMKLQNINERPRLCFEVETHTHKKAFDVSTVNRTLSRSNLIIFLAWLVWSANTCHSYRFSFIIIIIPASNYRKSVHKNTGWEPEQAFLTELVLNRFKELFYVARRHRSSAQIADLVSGFLPSPLPRATGGDSFVVSITVSFRGLSIPKRSEAIAKRQQDLNK